MLNTKLNYRNWFVQEYITYLNIWGVLSRKLYSLSTMTITHCQTTPFSHGLTMRTPFSKALPIYIQVSDGLCYKPIHIIYRTSLLQTFQKLLPSKMPIYLNKLGMLTVVLSNILFDKLKINLQLNSLRYLFCGIFLYDCHNAGLFTIYL